MNAMLKIDPSRLPKPLLPPTKPYRTPLTPVVATWDAIAVRDEERAKKYRESAKKHTPNAWPDEDHDILVSMHRQGKRISEIAQRLGRSEKACRERLYRTGEAKRQAPKPRWTIGRTDELMTMVRNGYSAKEAAAKLGVSANAAQKRLQKIRKLGYL